MICQYSDTIAAAERALVRRFGEPLKLTSSDAVVDYPGAAAIILRCRLESSSIAAPELVVVKRSMSETQHLFREWANLEFLSSLPETSSLLPALYGGDENSEILVMEDVSVDRELLGNIVEGHDPERAEAGLIAFQQALGRFHAVTAGKTDNLSCFPVRRQSDSTSRHVIHRTSQTLRSLPHLLTGEGVTLQRELAEEIETMRRQIADPGPFLVFTHGDAAIGNVFYSQEHGTRLIDFETGAYRHALLDGCYSRMRYLVSVWARRLPLSLQRRLLDTYREQMTQGCPEATDDQRFNSGLLACSAFWLGAILQHLPSVEHQDRRFGRSTYRQRIVAALDHFVQLSEDLGNAGPVAVASDDLRHRLRSRWPEDECTMRLCNSFQNASIT